MKEFIFRLLLITMIPIMLVCIVFLVELCFRFIYTPLLWLFTGIETEIMREENFKITVGSVDWYMSNLQEHTKIKELNHEDIKK